MQDSEIAVASSTERQNDETIVIPDTSEVNLLRRQPPEPRPSTDNSPGTSGEPAPQPSASSAPVPPARSRSFAHIMANRERDIMFWSLGNNQRTTLFSGTRPMTHTPVPDLMERPRASSPNTVIQRILALKRLSRNYNSRPRMRPNTTFYAVPATRPHPYPMRNPSYPAPPSGHGGGNVHPRPARMYPEFRRTRSMMHNPYSGGPVILAVGQPGPAAVALGRRAASAADMPLHHMPADNHLDNAHSDEEIDISRASTSAADANNDNNTEQEHNENMEGIGQNTADGAISLEEEIVEIDASEVTIVDGDGVIDEEAQHDDETQEVLTIIRDMEEIPTRNTDEVVVQESAQPHGVKRKRDGTVEISTPYTVKDFNQCLLRLLECPVCLEWMEPPIAQCRRGHLVCARCRGRLASCPVCRTMFSSVRNRAMEGVAEMLRYPCRHGCGREVRLRRRGPHEASCPARKYYCPAPACLHRNPLPRDQLAAHFQGKHLSMLKIGSTHKFTIKINAELSDDWLIMTLDELFHLRVDVDIRSWGVIVYVAYIGPKCKATNYIYEVAVDGHHNARRLNYTRATHCDLDISALNMSRHDCFNLTLDQAMNFLRFNNRNCESERFLDFTVEVKKCVQPVDTNEDMDS